MLPNRPGYRPFSSITTRQGYQPPNDSVKNVTAKTLESWAKTNAQFVDQGDGALQRSSKKIGLFTTDVKCCITVTLTAYDFETKSIALALGHYDNVSEELPISFLAEKLLKKTKQMNRLVRTISLKLIGGHTQPQELEPLKSNACSQVRGLLRNRYTLVQSEFVLNPYNVTETMGNYEKEFDLIGFSLNVGLTHKGRVTMAFESISMQYSDARMSWLKAFMEADLRKLRVIASTCKSNEAIKANATTLLAQISKQGLWVSPRVEQNFNTQYQRFQKYLSQ